MPLRWFRRRKADEEQAPFEARLAQAEQLLGIEALKLVRRRGRSVKHLRFEDGPDSE